MDNADSDVTHISDAEEEDESNTEVVEEDPPIEIRLHFDEQNEEAEGTA